MKFGVVFTNRLNEEYILKYNVYNNSISTRWYNLLKQQVLEIDNTVKEPDRLYNFPNGEWDEEKLVDELNICIETINSTNTVIHHTAFVGMPQEQLNHLHHYFEDLRGGTLTPGDYWQNANEQQRSALERYNVIIHRAENFYRQTTTNYYPRIVVRFSDRQRVQLLDEDYEHFTLNRKFGEVYINYCEVGKPLYDVFKDDDDIVGEDNIRPLRWYSPDFTAYFHDRGQNNVDKFLNAMDIWWDQNNNYLTALGFIKGDPKNAIGNIPIAMLETNRSREEVINDLCTYNSMKRVEVYE